MRYQQSPHLPLERCPHCSVAKPLLQRETALSTADHSGRNSRQWAIYVCSHCGGLVTTGRRDNDIDISEMYPQAQEVSPELPDRAREYLLQAIGSLNAPAGAVVLTASSVDAMLKEKGYKTGTLYSRIDQAVAEHLITREMGDWAHEVRLGANDQRHADEEADLPTEEDARRCVAFVLALAEFLFVLPARVERGRKEVAGGSGGKKV